jgi:radical SAM superfamily enzyme YgiQ (UPF0313 family)
LRRAPARGTLAHPMSRDALLATIRRRLGSEIGRIDKSAPFRVGLAYPSPYRAGMSSLGFLQIYKAVQAEDGMCAERAFLADDEAAPGQRDAPLTYEGHRTLGELPVVALSVAYELELAGVVKLLEAAGIPPLREDRTGRHPLIVAGGPLTFSNPLPLAAFADAVVMGEADTLAVDALRAVRDAGYGDHPGRSGFPREAALDALAAIPHVFVPSRHTSMPGVAQCADELLPAWSPIRTPEAELSGMFLIETERGCSRGCTYCVMRRSTNGGMRIVPKDRILELIPADARRVGLVGAAVSDHPHIASIVRTLAERGAEVGLSSLRPDRLDDALVGALKLAGYKTLTTAMDGASDKIRDLLDRKARIRHLERAADLARAHKMTRLKLYLMVGVPGETDEDIDECVEFTASLSKKIPVALGVAPFCPKRNTPLAGAPFAGIAVVQRRLDRLRRGLRGRAEVRATSARWAWVEAVLARGGEAEGRAVLAAVHDGGTFAAYERAFEALEGAPKRSRKSLPVLAHEGAR